MCCPVSRGFWERRFETAWRMGQWADMAEAQPALADGGRFPLFNQAICTCFKVPGWTTCANAARKSPRCRRMGLSCIAVQV